MRVVIAATRTSVCTKCTKRPVTSVPKVVALEQKLVEIKKAIITELDETVKEELYAELHKVKDRLKDITYDPLANDFCTDEPWADECRIYDV